MRRRPDSLVGGNDVTPVVEIRTYKLVPRSWRTFEEMVRERSLPMLERYGIRVVAHGPSADGDDHYYLIRAFSSAAQRKEQLEAFYGSSEWRENHRDAFLALIEAFHTVAIELTPDIREALISVAGAAEAAGHRRPVGSDDRRVISSPFLLAHLSDPHMGAGGGDP
jgi:NIPSNAP